MVNGRDEHGVLLEVSREGMSDKDYYLHAWARRAAGDWHNGSRSPLYALCSSGAIIDGCDAEVEGLYDHTTTDAMRDELFGLQTYVTNEGIRPNVKEWSTLPWVVL